MGLFTIAALSAANTANAYRPFTRTGVASLPVMGLGMLTSELPLHTLGAQSALALRSADRDTLRRPKGVVAAGLLAASAAGLVGLHRAAGRSGEVFERALVDGLGPAYSEGVTPDVRARHEAPITRKQVALPSMGKRRLRLGRDLSYGPSGERNLLDIWRRDDLPLDGRAPVLLQIHGGAWVMGHKAQQALPLMSHMAELGWVVVSINYRLSPADAWPAHIQDVMRAIAWIKANIADHGGDPEFIAVTGGSAGGHLSSLAALSANDPRFQPGFEDADTTVQAAVPVYGQYDNTNRSGASNPTTLEFLAEKVLRTTFDDDLENWEAGSPICRVHADAPPMFVIHGTNDAFLPVEQARAFVDAARAASTNPVIFAELPYAEHGFDGFRTVRVHHMVHAIERFLTHVHARADVATPSPDATPNPGAR